MRRGSQSRTRTCNRPVQDPRNLRPRRCAAEVRTGDAWPAKNDLRLLPCQPGQMLSDVVQCTLLRWILKVNEPRTNCGLHLPSHLAHVEGDIPVVGYPIMDYVARGGRLDEAITPVAAPFRDRPPL